MNFKHADLAGAMAIASVLVVFIALLLLGFSPGNLVGILVPSFIIAGLSEAVMWYRRMRDRKKSRSDDIVT